MTNDPEDYEWSVVDRSQSPPRPRSGEYRVADEFGVDLGTVRLSEGCESIEDLDRWEREEFRDSGCQCHAFPDSMTCTVCRLVDGE